MNICSVILYEPPMALRDGDSRKEGIFMIKGNWQIKILMLLHGRWEWLVPDGGLWGFPP